MVRYIYEQVTVTQYKVFGLMFPHVIVSFFVHNRLFLNFTAFFVVSFVLGAEPHLFPTLVALVPAVIFGHVDSHM